MKTLARGHGLFNDGTRVQPGLHHFRGLFSDSRACLPCGNRSSPRPTMVSPPFLQHHVVLSVPPHPRCSWSPCLTSSSFSVPPLVLWKHILKQCPQKGGSVETRVPAWWKQPQIPPVPGSVALCNVTLGSGLAWGFARASGVLPAET